MDRKTRKTWLQIGFGLFLIVVGGLLLLDYLDFSFLHVSVWHLWPLIILVIGIGKLVDADDAREYRGATFLLFIGSWLLVNELHLFGLSYHETWPLLLVGWGISMVAFPGARHCRHHSVKEAAHGN